MTDHQRCKAKAAAFIEMESEIRDLAEMANAACLLLELYEEQRETVNFRDHTAGEYVLQTEQWFRSVAFGVEHLRGMAKALKHRYEAAAA